MPVRGPVSASRQRSDVTERYSLAKKIVAGIYDRTARQLYEPIVVQRAFPLFGGSLEELARAQGRKAVALAGGGTILDMPVGTAHFTVEAARRHPGIVVGADIAAGMLREARAQAARAAVANIQPVQADAHHLPFRDGSFAAILCTNGLQVIPGLRPAVRELARVLAPGGILYVSVVTLPLSRLVPRDAGERLPTFARAGIDVAAALGDAGLYVSRVERSRLATLIEALNPAKLAR